VEPERLDVLGHGVGGQEEDGPPSVSQPSQAAEPASSSPMPKSASAALGSVESTRLTYPGTAFHLCARPSLRGSPAPASEQRRPARVPERSEGAGTR
jgi:hypothetical protein